MAEAPAPPNLQKTKDKIKQIEGDLKVGYVDINFYQKELIKINECLREITEYIEWLFRFKRSVAE